MKRLCYSFLQQADRIWNAIAEADQYGLSYGEETITDNVLLYLKKHHRRHVHLRSFSKKEERHNGADWEWWIGREGQWNGMRVQAKRIKLPREEYKSLFYKSKKSTKLQIDHLIDEAIANNLTPIFTLYSHSKKLLHLQTKNNHCYPSRNGPFNQNGCLVAHAQHVRNTGSLKLSDIESFSFPWHLLACDCSVDLGPSRGPGTNPSNISQMLAYPFEGAPTGEDDIFVAEPNKVLPDHMRAIMKDDGESQTWIEKYCREWNLAGLALIDLGKRDE